MKNNLAGDNLMPLNNFLAKIKSQNSLYGGESPTHSRVDSVVWVVTTSFEKATVVIIIA